MVTAQPDRYYQAAGSARAFRDRYGGYKSTHILGQKRAVVCSRRTREKALSTWIRTFRSDIVSGQPGAPLQLALQVVRAGDCATLANARVDVWQADALGLYSGYENQSGVGGVSTKSAAGRAVSARHTIYKYSGNVQFRTIFPSSYGGRTPHVHFKVFLAGNEVVAATSSPEDIIRCLRASAALPGAHLEANDLQ